MRRFPGAGGSGGETFSIPIKKIVRGKDILLKKKFSFRIKPQLKTETEKILDDLRKKMLFSRRLCPSSVIWVCDKEKKKKKIKKTTKDVKKKRKEKRWKKRKRK